jgi:hypothetical protein
MVSARTHSVSNLKADVVIRYQSVKEVIITGQNGRAEKMFHSLKAALDHCEESRRGGGMRVAVTDTRDRLIGNLFL